MLNRKVEEAECFATFSGCSNSHYTRDSHENHYIQILISVKEYLRYGFTYKMPSP